MTTEEKRSLLDALYLTRQHLEVVTEKRVADTRATYDSMMQGIAKVGFPDLAAELTAAASRLLDYIEEHKEPLRALQRTIDFAENTEAANLEREQVFQIAEESGWLSLRDSKKE